MAKDAFAGEAIATALTERWGEELQEGERFDAQLETDEREAKLTVAVVGADGAERHEFEVRVRNGSRGPAAARDTALDATDALVGLWLEDGRPRLPGNSEEREWEGTPVLVTARRINPRLQAEADRLLGESDEGGLDS